jgi:hypothetical protein
MRRCSELIVPVFLLAILVPPAAAEGVRAIPVGTYNWVIDDPNFGGWSGIDMAADGVSFRAISDAGYTLSGALERDSDGRVASVKAGPILLMRGDEAELLAPNVRDAEGLAVAPDGTYTVSFEGNHRIASYKTDEAAALILTDRDYLADYPINNGIEALAIAENGDFYAIPEVRLTWGGDYPVYVYHAGSWSTALSLPADGTFRPVGADFGPDGKLYLLERDFWGLVGFMSKIRRITLDGDRVVQDETLFESRAGQFQNLEGLAVWTDALGGIRLTAISDDNYLSVLRTQIVDFRLSE